MSFSISKRRSATRLTMFSAAVLGLAASAAMGQTAPQLLPYTSKLIAGSGVVAIGLGATCPISGFKSTDAYGDGCLATEILLGNNTTGSTPGARSAASDANGNVFFTDYNNALVRRVDAISGIVTAVAGGGTAVAGTSSGVLATTVKLGHPAGIAFAPNGDLYFSDPYNYQVFKVAATNGFITTSGIITLAAGSSAGTPGYGASNATTTVTVAAGNSYLRSPYGIAFDTKGDLFIVDEYTEAILVLNTNATGTNTVNSVPVAAGTIWKVAGTTTGATAPYCVNGTATGYGCAYGLYTPGIAANTDSFDSTYSVAVDGSFNLYAGVEYYDSVFEVNPAGILNNFAGVQNKAAKLGPTERAPAGSFGIGSVFGVAADALDNVYIGDASAGLIWRVDGAGLSMYAVAGGASSTCTNATDAYGDGCPARQAKLGSSGTGLYATATLPGPGVYGVSVDANADLFFGDTETNLVREIASGTQFGVVGANQPTDIVDIHFAQGDTPAASAYQLTAGTGNFTLGSATCTANTDTTTDCLLPVTATPSTLGLFTGTLKVTSTLGGVATFPLSGTYAQSPTTRTAVTFSGGTGACAGSTFGTGTAITLTATLVANGPSAPTGTITFYSNGTAIGMPQTVVNLGTTTNPVYGATTSYTFTTVGTYTITATYSGDTYFKTSTGTASGKITTATPGFTAVLSSYAQGTVTPGQTALFAINLGLTVYTGTLTFTATGLPANSTAVFSPSALPVNGCSTLSGSPDVVALSILTQAQTTVQPGGFGGSGSGRWQALGACAGLGLALLIGIRRRRVPMRYGQLWMAIALLLAASGALACGKGVGTVLQPATPAGLYPITVTVTGSAGTVATVPVTLIVN